MSLWDALRQYMADAGPGGALNPEWTPELQRQTWSTAQDFTPVWGGIKGYQEEMAAGNPGWALFNAATVPVDLLTMGTGGAAMKALPLALGLGTIANRGRRTGGLIEEIPERLVEIPDTGLLGPGGEPIISTARPTGDNPIGDYLREFLGVDTKTLLQDPRQTETVLGKLGEAPGMARITGDAAGRAEEFVQRMKDNLLFLYDRIPAEFAEQAKEWYVGANTLAKNWGKQFGFPTESVAGVLATLSPGKEWFMNVGNAERLMTSYNELRGKVVPKDAIDWLEANYKNKGGAEAIAEIKTGKLFDELSLDGKAAAVRGLDQARHPQQYREMLPNGKFTGWVTNNDGSRATHVWQSGDNVKKAISVLEDPSIDNISRNMGNAHKVRNFYNNIISPFDYKPHVTGDTWQVAANLMMPYGQKTPQVQYNLSGPGTNANTGIKGTYPLHADAVRAAAAERGHIPREMQSITWEVIRAMFPKEIKASLRGPVGDIWAEVDKGNIPAERARELILKMRGGTVDLPPWFKPGVPLAARRGKSKTSMYGLAPFAVGLPVAGLMYAGDEDQYQ